MANPKQKWVTMSICVREDKAIYAEQCDCKDLAVLLHAVHQSEAVFSGLSTREIDHPHAFAVYESSGKADGTWRALLHDRDPLWRARVIYAFVAGGRIRDFGSTQCLRKRVHPNHERLKTIAANHPEGWKVYAIPVQDIEDDKVFHGMFPRGNLELMTEYRGGLFTPDGELKYETCKQRLVDRPGRTRVFSV